MKYKAVFLALMAATALPLKAQSIDNQIKQLKKQTEALKQEVKRLEREVEAHDTPTKKSLSNPRKKYHVVHKKGYHIASVKVHTSDEFQIEGGFFPTALVADNHVLTYIAGTPVVTSPYLGSRPAFDGSDYIVNISSINRDIRLLQQRRMLYQSYQHVGYEAPDRPLMALSGKVEPTAFGQTPYYGRTTGDLTLGSSEFDVTAILNRDIEAFMAINYAELPYETIAVPRVSRSVFFLNMGFINIGDLEKTPFYMTAGQIYVPFGRYSTGMISPTLPLLLTRTRARPLILGYKSQSTQGPFAAIYGYRSETEVGKSGIGGLNVGYTIAPNDDLSGEVGFSYIGTLADATQMQLNGAPDGQFGGFANFLYGSENVGKLPGLGFHGYLNYDRYSLTVEWVGATQAYSPAALSYNGYGAKPEAGQIEAGLTFMNFEKPASFNVTYQWSKEALALLIPKQRMGAVYSISIWKDTVESLEYRHDIDYSSSAFANGIGPNAAALNNTVGTGKTSDSVVAQIGVYF